MVSPLAKLLYEATKGPEKVLECTPECQKSFDDIKQILTAALALGLPNLNKPFELFVHERRHGHESPDTTFGGLEKTSRLFFLKNWIKYVQSGPAVYGQLPQLSSSSKKPEN